MIGKLRKKLVVVLMAVVCLFLIGILISLFLSARSNFEQRSFDSMKDRPLPPDAAPNGERVALPTAIVVVDEDGTITVRSNQIFYVTEDELIDMVAALEAQDDSIGVTPEYGLRYARRHADDKTRYYFTDTYIEQETLRSQVLYSFVIGLGALALFFGVSLLLSRWMVKPVEDAWEKQRQFVADASHELKTPLTVILSNTDMLLNSHAVTDEKNAVRLDNIKAESQRMKGLVENLLSLARTDAKAELAQAQPVSFSYTVTSSALTLEPTIFDAGRAMECDIAQDLTVQGDAAKLRQLVDILLDNAGKYSAAGSTIRVRLASISKRELLLEVSSIGAPLSPVDCRQVFERFYRLDQSRGQQTGYGLGLSIAQSIAKQHKGRIWAQSDGVSVNTFCVRLPCVEPALPSK